MDGELMPTPDAKGAYPELTRLYKSLSKAKRADKRWRKRAQEGVAFYFDRQWKAKDKEVLESRGQPVVTINRIKPTVRLVHGLVIAAPVDILAKPVGKQDDSVADTATASIKYVNNVNDYKTLRERVYFDALTYGVGWALAGFGVRTKDRRVEPVQNRRVDPREIRLDPQSQEHDISDARFVVWTRRVDLDDAKAMYPAHAKKLAGLVGLKDGNMVGDGPNAETWDGVPGETPPVSLWKYITDEYENWNQAGKDDEEADPKVIIHEFWERYPTQVWLLEMPDGTTEEFEGPETPEGEARIQDPQVVSYYQDTVFKVRYFVFAGPCLLVSEPSPYDHDRLPFVPCWCERDEYGDPVSLVESLKDPQREINHRRSRMLYEMTNRPLVISQATLQAMGMDVDEAAAHAAKMNAVWTSPEGASGIAYMSPPGDANANFQLMQDAKGEIQSVSGANDDLMGYDSSSKSGKAKEIQMSQGQMLMRPTESNLRAFDLQMAALNLQLIQQAHTEEWTIRIRDEVGRDKFITVNERVVDEETGMPRVLNSMDGFRFELELDQMPWTPTLRQRTADLINDMANNEPDPLIRNALRQAAIQASDIPDKAKILDIFAGAVEAAMAPPPMPPQVPQGPPPGMQPTDQMVGPDQMMLPPPPAQMPGGFPLPPELAG